MYLLPKLLLDSSRPVEFQLMVRPIAGEEMDRGNWAMVQRQCKSNLQLYQLT